MNMNPNPGVEASKCPLCGGPNQCALAADPSATQCWCDTEKFPRELLAQIPAKAVGRTCICQKCLTRYRGVKEAIDSPE
jgi:hypothetical protein